MNNKAIPYGKHFITEEDIMEVVNVLKSNFLTQGPKVLEFEKAFAKYIGCDYAVAVSNGTAALHLSALALGVKEKDKIITTSITFSASANCIKYCGGDVLFCDINPETYLIDILKLEEILTNSPKGTIKGIVVVDFAGSPNNLENFKKIAVKYGLWILEDACHSPGGFFVDSNNVEQKCGNGIFADLAIFSFHPVKHIAAGEGGMITTNNYLLYKKLLNLRTHGIQQDPNLKIYNDGPWYYEMQELGYNYRLTDIQAALGLSQLKRADEGLKRRIKIAEKYYNAFNKLENIIGQSGVINGHAYHLYIIEVNERDALYEYLRSVNIISQIHYVPVHLMPYYRNFGWKEGDLPNSEQYYKRCLSLPIFPTLTDVEQDFVINTILEFYNK